MISRDTRVFFVVMQERLHTRPIQGREVLRDLVYVEASQGQRGGVVVLMPSLHMGLITVACAERQKYLARALYQAHGLGRCCLRGRACAQSV